MKRLAAILLLLVFATQLFSKLAIMGYYHFNKQYIIQKYCENKEKPQMHCDGKCHLQKQLKKQEPENTKTPVQPNLKDIHESFVYFEQAWKNSVRPTCNFTVQTVYVFNVNGSGTHAVFHPPCCA